MNFSLQLNHSCRRAALLLMLVALGLCTAAAQASIESLYDNYVSSSGAARIEAQKKLVKLLADEQYIDPDYVNNKKQQEAVMCYGMAEYYSDANDYNKTKAMAQKALQLLNKHNNSLTSDIYGMLGIAEHRKGNFAASIKNLEAAYRIDLAIKDNERLSSDLNNLAGVYLASNDPQSAKYYILKGIDVERHIGRSDKLAIRLGMASEIFMKLHDSEQALKYAQEAYRLDQSGGRPGKAAVRLVQMAAVYMEAHDYAQAKQALKQALPQLEKDKNFNSLSIAYAQMGDIALYHGNNAQAAQYYNQSLAMCRTTGNRYIEDRAERGLWKALRESDPTAALSHLERHSELADSMYRDELAQQLSNFQAKYKTAELEHKNNEMKHRSKVALVIFILVVLLLVTGIGAMSFALKQKSKAHTMIKKIEEMRTNFFTNITHEFRTPLTVILGATSRLQRGELAAGETPASLYEMITRQGRSLLTLINQLLDISKVKSSIGHPDWRRGNIVTFTRMLVATHQEWAKAKHIDIQFASKENDIEMDFVPDYVRKVINNLLSNSIKYTPNHGSIYVTLARSGNDLRVRVADTGRGIDPEELPHIFDAFYQGANNTEHVGTGVGLALVKQIVTSMHGEIEVSSQLGQGTVFTILQSLRQAGHKNMQPLDTTAPLPAEPAHPLLEESDIVLPQGLANADDNSRTAPLVLIVEDDRDVAYYIGAQLQQRYSLRYASDGNEGLVLAQELMPDLVITDLMMHGCDGFELCQKMHESEALNHIPIIILTAKTADEDRIRGISTGADYYMTKPFNSEELAVRVDHLIEQRRLLRKKYSQAMIQDKASDVQLSKYDRDFINKLADLVHAQMPKGNVDVETIASRLCMSTKQLRSKVMTITGQNPNAYILQLRMNKARRLLASTQAPIGDIAMQCGFDDSAYFSRVFKQLFKTTPSQYRKSQ